MSGSQERLRESLRDLADTVRPADLYAGAVRRSRRIARREATVGTGAAALALALLVGGLWRGPSRPDDNSPLAQRQPAATPSTPETVTGSAPVHTSPVVPHRTYLSAGSTAQHRKHRPQVVESTPTPLSRSLSDLPGEIFYEQRGDTPDVVRLSPGDGDTDTVLADAPSPVGISPDGARIAYEVSGNLLVGPTGADHADQVATGVTTASQAPTWSPDGEHLLVDASAPAILHVGSGTLTPLPAGLVGQHFRWSGDGTKLVYATSFCGLQVARSSDGSGFAVPVLGDTQPVDNPDGLAACRPTSVDATGGRVTVPLRTTGATAAGGSDTADAVVDTVTGDVVPLPVAGTVVGAIFSPDGNLLVRTIHGGKKRLSLFAPDGTLLVQAAEPAAVKDLDLLAYTR